MRSVAWKILVLLLAVQFVFAADLTGVWKGSAGPLGQIVLTLSQTGNSLSGDIELGGQIFPIGNGSIGDDKIAFFISRAVSGRLLKLPFTATVRNGEMTLASALANGILRPDSPDAQTLAIERVAATMRLWGAIRFFHPYLAYRPIDWNGALISALPLIEKSQSNDEFARAITAMLGTLGDPETRVLGDGEPDPISSGPCQCRRIVRSGLSEGNSQAYYADWESVDRNAVYVVRLPGLRVAVRTAEPLRDDTTFQRSQDPDRADLPSREQRLLGLALYWNAIHYFDGYPELLEAWDSALEDFIPGFEAAQSREDYVAEIVRLASRTHDGHSGLTPLGLITILGKQPDVTLRHIGDDVVVTASNVAGVARGDVVDTVDGKPAFEVEKSLMNLFPWSTLRFGVYNADRFLLAGAAPSVRVGVRRSDGSAVSVELARNEPLATVRPTPVVPEAFGRLPSGVGYIDLTRLPEAEVDAAFDSMPDAPGIIFDLRDGGVHGLFQSVPGRLTDKPVPATRGRVRVWHGPDPAAMTEEGSVQNAIPSGKRAYRGPIAVLINASAFSQTEHTALFLEAAAAKTFFVGSPTSGTDGELTGILLPGHVMADFSGMSFAHGDGRELQRIGIIPDVWAEPTVAGIREGGDEVLDAAVKTLQRASGQ
jgi:C-terminal processing protease CtpA/Prc